MATASASAAPMIIVVRTSPDASGFRPIASIAPRTAKPIPMPGPIAPRPMAIAAPIYRTASGSVIEPNTEVPPSGPNDRVRWRPCSPETTHAASTSQADKPDYLSTAPVRRSSAKECRPAPKVKTGAWVLIAHRALRRNRAVRICVVMRMLIVMPMAARRSEREIDQGQQREDERLNRAEKDFKE